MADQVFKGTTLVGETLAPIAARLVTADDFAPGAVLLCPSPTTRHFARVIESAAMLCTTGGRTGHLPSVCRARGIPVILLDRSDLPDLETAEEVLVDPGLSTVTVLRRATTDRLAGRVPMEAVISTAEDIDLVNTSDAASRVDSFFIREEFLWAAHALVPYEEGSAPGHVETVRSELQQMLTRLRSHQALTFRLLDLRSDAEAHIAAGRGREPEPNPELGVHGVRRILAEPGYQKAVRHLVDDPAMDGVTFSIPFLNDETQVSAVFKALRVTTPRRWGVFVETPAAVHQLPRILDTGVSVVNVGTKDLVQFMLAADRNNHAVAAHYDTRHPSVLNALSRVAEACDGYDVTLRVYVLLDDLDYYRSRLPADTRLMLCAHELAQLPW